MLNSVDRWPAPGPAQAQKCAHGKSGLATQRHRSPANLSHLVPACALCTSNCDLSATPSGRNETTAFEPLIFVQGGGGGSGYGDKINWFMHWRKASSFLLFFYIKAAVCFTYMPSCIVSCVREIEIKTMQSSSIILWTTCHSSISDASIFLSCYKVALVSHISHYSSSCSLSTIQAGRQSTVCLNMPEHV